jgi:hypothetical protein
MNSSNKRVVPSQADPRKQSGRRGFAEALDF